MADLWHVVSTTGLQPVGSTHAGESEPVWDSPPIEMCSPQWFFWRYPAIDKDREVAAQNDRIGFCWVFGASCQKGAGDGIVLPCIYLCRRKLSKLKQILFGTELCSWSSLKCVDNVRRGSHCCADNVADVSWILGDWKERSQSCCSSQLHEICFLLVWDFEGELQISRGTPGWMF